MTYFLFLNDFLSISLSSTFIVVVIIITIRRRRRRRHHHDGLLSCTFDFLKKRICQICFPLK